MDYRFNSCRSLAFGIGHLLHHEWFDTYPFGGSRRCHSCAVDVGSKGSVTRLNTVDHGKIIMNMNKLISIALLAGGIVLIVLGVSATNSFTSDVSRFFTGSPTDKAIWMLIGGAAATLIGLFGLMRRSRHAA